MYVVESSNNKPADFENCKNKTKFGFIIMECICKISPKDVLVLMYFKLIKAPSFKNGDVNKDENKAARGTWPGDGPTSPL